MPRHSRRGSEDFSKVLLAPLTIGPVCAVVSTIEVPESVGKMPLARGGPQPKGLCPELLSCLYIYSWTVFYHEIIVVGNNHHSGMNKAK